MEKTRQFPTRTEKIAVLQLFDRPEVEEIKRAYFEQITNRAEKDFAAVLASIEDINDFLKIDEAAGALCSAYEKLGFFLGYAFFKTYDGYEEGGADE